MELDHTRVAGYAKGLTPEQAAPVYLMYGDEMLVKQAYTTVVDALVPRSEQSLNLVPFSGADDSVASVCEALETYPMFPATKVVAWLETRILASRQDTEKLLDKSREAWAADEKPKAARAFLDFLGVHGLSLADVLTEDPAEAMAQAAGISAPGDWAADVAAYCRDENLTATGPGDAAEVLAEAITRGFPPGHHLVLTADVADKRKRLYKLIAEHGVAVNCAVPQGMRKADRDAQVDILTGVRDKVLGQHGKTMEPAAFHALHERTGMDMRSFSTSLEKLVLHAGDRAKITVADVDELVPRSRQDPIFEFTGAVYDRDAARALTLLRRLLDNEMHPLQAAAALVNQNRKILAARAFLDGPHGRSWRANMTYPQFTSTVFPQAKKHDEELLSLLEEDMAREAPDGGKGKKKAKKPQTDLLVAAGARSPYPVYQNVLKASRFTREELLAAVDALLDADRRLKRSGTDPAMILERVVLALCKAGRPPGRT